MFELVICRGAKFMIVFSTILCMSDELLLQFLMDRMTLWTEFMMHNAVAVEENSEQNFHIWPD